MLFLFHHLRSPMKRRHILITNDDGIHAPGLQALCDALSPIADITVVAPAYEQSCVGLSITTRTPLKIEKHLFRNQDFAAFSVTGTPADCVKLALNVVLETAPDLVVSGINRGSNAGRNILYSGTVAGAIEGALHDIPAIAFSCLDYFETDYQVAALHIPKIVNHVLCHRLTEGSFLNINFPTKELKIQGYKMTKQGKEYWAEEPKERFHPVEGHAYYWIGAKLKAFEEEEDSDISWLQKGYITAVPVNISSLTDLGQLNHHRHRFDNLF